VCTVTGFWLEIAYYWQHFEVFMIMAQLRNLEIGIDATDQLLIQFKLENILNFVG